MRARLRVCTCIGMVRTRARWAITSFAIASRGVDFATFATFAAMMVALCAGLSSFSAYYDTR